MLDFNRKLAGYLAIDATTVTTLARTGDTAQDDDLLATTLQALTPRLMRWSHELWLLDLGACASYWQARAASLGEAEPLSLVRRMVQTLLGQGCRAVLADHPWKAVLLQHHLRERRLSGFVLGYDTFGETRYRDVSWQSWWACATELAEHLAATTQGRRRFDQALFRRQGLQMRRAVRRLGLSLPWQLQRLDGAAIKRRFGAVWRDVWEWAYADSQPAAGELLFPSSFPWRGVVLASQPSVSRYFEEPIGEWQHLEALLREDFDRLCELSSWLAGERVVSLEWRLVLRDLSHHNVPIRFRHPHSLHLEKGLHATALLQALYSFEASQQAQIKQSRRGRRGPTVGVLSTALVRDDGRDDGTTLVPVTAAMPIAGWELVITERLTLPPLSLGLFGDQVACGAGTGSSADFMLLQLENKLPVSLSRYRLQADWLPEDSYGVGEAECAAKGADQAHEECLPSLTAVARRRPLYLYERPTVYDGKGCSSLWRFSERTMEKWWRVREPAPTVARDYYRLTDRDGRELWVYKDGQGQCFLQGLFA